MNLLIMKIFSIKTHKIRPYEQNLFEILDRYLKFVKEEAVVAITSKIVSICDGRVAKLKETDRKRLIEKEAEYFLPPEKNKYNVTLTIKGNLLIPTAGIDESNGNEHYILWPKDPQETANKVRQHLRKRFLIKKLGVIITDSKTTPLRWGTTGVAISCSGFSPLYDYIGKRDIFGRKFKMQKANIADALAAAAVLVMGEGAEQTPLAIIEDIPFVKFQEKNPSKKELKDFLINMDDDLYGPLLKSVKWKKGMMGK
ncbi:MAG: coenzyme F420-0:L-glutamate ligase [Patescibacteria group bacterium]